MALKRLPQGNIHIIHADRIAKVYKACHAKTRIGDAAGRDPLKMRKIRFNIEAEPVKAHPFFEPYTQS